MLSNNFLHCSLNYIQAIIANLIRNQYQASDFNNNLFQHSIKINQKRHQNMRSEIIIDQQLQQPKKFQLSNHPEVSSQNKNRLAEQIQTRKLKSKTRQNKNENVESYALVLQQALTSNDKGILEDIIDENDTETIQNTLKNLSKAKISDFLKFCEVSMLHSHRKTNSIQKWLKFLLVLHLSTVVNSQQCKDSLANIRKIIQKRCQNYKKIDKLANSLPNRKSGVEKAINSKIKPKFQYNQEQIVNQEGQQAQQAEGNQNEQEMLGEQQFEQAMDYYDEQF